MLWEVRYSDTARRWYLYRRNYARHADEISQGFYTRAALDFAIAKRRINWHSLDKKGLRT